MNWMVGILLVVFCVSAWAQSGPSSDPWQRREELHKRLRESVLGGADQSPEETMKEMEELMDSLLQDAFQGTRAFKSQSLREVERDIEFKWEEGQHGRSLIVTPKDPATKIDVEVLKGIISLRSEVKKAGFASRMTHNQSVPGDCDGDKVKIHSNAGKLVLFFPWMVESKASGAQGRKPLKPTAPEVDV